MTTQETMMKMIAEMGLEAFLNEASEAVRNSTEEYGEEFQPALDAVADAVSDASCIWDETCEEIAAAV